jgi:hypothetical protein
LYLVAKPKLDAASTTIAARFRRKHSKPLSILMMSSMKKFVNLMPTITKPKAYSSPY